MLHMHVLSSDVMCLKIISEKIDLCHIVNMPLGWPCHASQGPIGPLEYLHLMQRACPKMLVLDLDTICHSVQAVWLLTHEDQAKACHAEN